VQFWMITDLAAIAAGSLILFGVVVGPIGRALGDRLRHGKLPRPGQGDAAEGLRDEMERLRLQVDELHERLDFAERLLAQVREKGQLGPGGQ
jgi:hypothetical protein